MREFRIVTLEDAKEILDIYTPYIDTTITFEYEVPSLESFTKRIDDIMTKYPYIACVEDEKIIGYAYAHELRERAAYAWTAELSVYVDMNKTSDGVGKQLYSKLIEILKLQNVKSVYGVVTHPNEKSEKMHESFGFRNVGILKNNGYKCDGWQDVVWFEKLIGEHQVNPPQIIPANELPKNLVENILKNQY